MKEISEKAKDDLELVIAIKNKENDERSAELAFAKLLYKPSCAKVSCKISKR